MGTKKYKDGHIFVVRRGRARKAQLESVIWSWPDLVGIDLWTSEGRGKETP